MEHIKKAIAKAKRNGNGRRAPAGDLHETTSAPIASEGVVYSQTQKVTVSPRTLLKNRVVAGLKHDVRAGPFHMLRTQLLKAMRENAWRTVALTSPMPDVGKTLVAVNLAVSISLEVNQTVLLVDLDLRHPSVANYFDIRPQYGVSDYLLADVPLSSIFVNPGMPRLVLLPGKGSIANSSERLSTPKMLGLVEELKARYESRLILFDLPPLLSTDDALVFLPQVDAALMMVEDGKTTEEEVRHSLRLLEGTNLLGTVLNKVDGPVRSYY